MATGETDSLELQQTKIYEHKLRIHTIILYRLLLFSDTEHKHGSEAHGCK